MSPWLIQTCERIPGQLLLLLLLLAAAREALAFLRIFPRMWPSRFSPSKHMASTRPLPSILMTWAYSVCERECQSGYSRRLAGDQDGPCPSSLKTSSRLSPSFSFFPRLRFFPPCG